MRLALYVCLKNICDGIGRPNGSNGSPLNPPLFWLDNIFNKICESSYSFRLKKTQNSCRSGRHNTSHFKAWFWFMLFCTQSKEDPKSQIQVTSTSQPPTLDCRLRLNRVQAIIINMLITFACIKTLSHNFFYVECH